MISETTPAPTPALAAPARPATGTAVTSTPSTVAQKPTAPAATPAVGTASPRFHTVAVGESLSKISLQYYGTTARWTEILAANRDLLRDERSLVAGRVLRIP